MDAKSTPNRLLTAYDEFGWKQVKVSRELKKPVYDDWQKITVPREDLRRHVEGGGNVGIQAGQVSDWICAADLDSEEAVRMAPKFLPETLKSGKQGIPTHWIYRSPGAGYRQFRDVDRTMLLELKASENGAGHQFVVEPSTHPEKGPYRWMPAFNPALVAEVSKEDLTSRLGHLAAAVLIARNFPPDGGHDYANSLCGYLLRNGTPCEDLEVILEACWPADKVRHHNVTGAVATTAAKLSRNEPVTGGRTLEGLAPGLPKALAKALGWAHREIELGKAGHESQGRHLTDMGNAERFVDQAGHKVRYCYEWGTWLVFDGARWARDVGGGRVRKLAKTTVRAIYREVAAVPDDAIRKATAKHASASEAAARMDAMLKLAECEVAITPDELDSDPYLLNCLNGTVDLRTGDLRDHRQDDFLTKIAPVGFDPTATAPLFTSFLERVQPNEQVREFLKRAVGYGASAEVSEQCLFINHGNGMNGKSTFQEAIAAVLGDYSMRAPTEMLMSRRTGGIPNDIARLKGARFVAASETEEGRRLAESLVKDLTGSDTITARFMRAEFFDFSPTHKLFLSTNHKPEIRGTDLAIWRRIRLIPWDVKIPPAEEDKKLTAKIQDELPGVLNWIVAGCLLWQDQGLNAPEEVRAATKEYRTEMDTLARFIEERCVVGESKEIQSAILYRAYKSWCDETGEEKQSQVWFSKRLSERGFERRKEGLVFWFGIGLGQDPQNPGPNLPKPEGPDQNPPDNERPANADKNAESAGASGRFGTVFRINSSENKVRVDNHKNLPNPPNLPKRSEEDDNRAGRPIVLDTDFTDPDPPPMFGGSGRS
jgi:P4 family phage/plasmid primase-like protien